MSSLSGYGLAVWTAVGSDRSFGLELIERGQFPRVGLFSSAAASAFSPAAGWPIGWAAAIAAGTRKLPAIAWLITAPTVCRRPPRAQPVARVAALMIANGLCILWLGAADDRRPASRAAGHAGDRGRSPLC